MMIDDIPDPFGPPDEMIAMMKGLRELHAAAMLSGLPEHVATKFIADVFIGFSVMNAPQDAEGSGNAVE